MSDFALDPAARARLWARLMELVEQVLEVGPDEPVARPPNMQKVEATLRRLDGREPVDPVEALDAIVFGMSRQTVRTGHPRYFGLFNPAASAMGVAAEMLAAAFNPQLATFAHAPLAVSAERSLVRDLGVRFGYDSKKSAGVFTSGGAEANLTAVWLAIEARIPDYRKCGLRRMNEQPLVYVSEETHPSATRAVRLAGLGEESVRPVPGDAVGRMDPNELARAVAQDRAEGGAPIAVIATAGSTTCGAVDSLDGIAEVAAREGLWLHVDAAWGGLLALSPRASGALDGIARADSITFDPHKALAAPMGAGLILTRHPDVLARTFAASAAYMPHGRGEPDPYQTGMAWSRRFTGLKVLLTLAVAGWAGVEEAVDRQLALGDHLRGRLARSGFHAVNESPLPLVCARRAGASDAFHRAVAAAVCDSGRAWLTAPRWRGKNVLRAAVVHHRTTEADVDALGDALDAAAERV